LAGTEIRGSVDDREIQIVFRAEALVDAANTEAGRAREITHRGGVVTPLGEDAVGRLQEEVAVRNAMARAAI
jgi:hypothetical protein